MELIPIWVTSIAASIGVIYSLAKNGRSSKAQDAKLKHDILADMKTIKDRLDDPDTGLRAIKKESADMKIHCINTSLPIVAALKTNTDDIERLKNKMDK